MNIFLKLTTVMVLHDQLEAKDIIDITHETGHILGICFVTELLWIGHAGYLDYEDKTSHKSYLQKKNMGS